MNDPTGRRASARHTGNGGDICVRRVPRWDGDRWSIHVELSLTTASRGVTVTMPPEHAAEIAEQIFQAAVLARRGSAV